MDDEKLIVSLLQEQNKTLIEIEKLLKLLVGEKLKREAEDTKGKVMPI